LRFLREWFGFAQKWVYPLFRFIYCVVV